MPLYAMLPSPHSVFACFPGDFVCLHADANLWFAFVLSFVKSMSADLLRACDAGRSSRAYLSPRQGQAPAQLGVVRISAGIYNYFSSITHRQKSVAKELLVL